MLTSNYVSQYAEKHTVRESINCFYKLLKGLFDDLESAHVQAFIPT